MLVSEKEILEIAAQLHLKIPATFSRLYNAYAPAIMSTIQRVVSCVSTSEDILQNVMIKIWKQADKYEAEKGRLFTWMITIARNETIDYVRSKQKMHSFSNIDELDHTEADPFSTDRLAKRMDMRNMIGTLPIKERSILELYLAGFTCNEISQLLQVPDGTVKTRMRTSYRRLRLALQN
jgi:RNA polymerase sigma-70 factor (ECF subfamily)